MDKWVLNKNTDGQTLTGLNILQFAAFVLHTSQNEEPDGRNGTQK